MAVIKRAQASTIGRDAIVLNLGDIAQHAEMLRKQAQDRADKIIQDAHVERESLVSSGFETGKADGYSAGYQDGLAKGEEEGRKKATLEAREQLDQIEGSWNSALDEFADIRHHLLVECKESVIQLSLSIAERVIHRMIEVDDRVVVAQVAHALKLIGRPTRARVLINPEDGAMVRRALPTVSARFGAIEHVICEEDDSIARGGCKVLTAEGGEIDASIQSQIDRIAQTLIPSIELTQDTGDTERGDRAA